MEPISHKKDRGISKSGFVLKDHREDYVKDQSVTSYKHWQKCK